MMTFRGKWEANLDNLEIESANLLACSSIFPEFSAKVNLSFKKNLNYFSFFSFSKEQLDGAGVELPKLHKMIESQVPKGCYSESSKRRDHWVGTQATKETVESLANEETFLHTHRPVQK